MGAFIQNVRQRALIFRCSPSISQGLSLIHIFFGTFHGEVSKYVDEKYPDLMRSAGIAEVLQFYFASFLGIKLDVNYVALQIPYRLAGFNLGTARIINYAHSMEMCIRDRCCSALRFRSETVI